MQQHYELPPEEGFILTHVLPVADVKRSAAFYADVFGRTIVREGSPTIVLVANTWVLVDVGGGPTEDKPTVTLAPPKTADEVSCFMNIRVADIRSCTNAGVPAEHSLLQSRKTLVESFAATFVTRMDI
jgi:predicted enzyme related to lactoylglutathione lyase